MWIGSLVWKQTTAWFQQRFHVTVTAMAHNHLNNLRSLQGARDQCRRWTFNSWCSQSSSEAGKVSSLREVLPPFWALWLPHLPPVSPSRQPVPASREPPLPHEEYFRPLHLVNFYSTSQVKKQKCEYGFGHSGQGAQWGTMPGWASDYYPSWEGTSSPFWDIRMNSRFHASRLCQTLWTFHKVLGFPGTQRKGSQLPTAARTHQHKR